MAIIPTQNKYPDRAGYLGLDTDRNVLSVMSDGKMKSISIPEGWINVKDFGAKGDGIHDDTAVFQQCLGQDNVNIYIPNGTYLISERINVGSNINVLGESWNTIILCTESGQFYPLYSGNLKFYNFTVSSFNFDKSLRTAFVTRQIFFLSHSSNITFNRINFKNINGYSIYAYKMNNLTIKNCNFYNAGIWYVRFHSTTGRFMHNKMYADIDFENDFFVYQLDNSHMLYFDNESENCGIGSTSTAGQGTFGLTYIIFGGRAILDSNVDRNPRVSNFGFAGYAYDCKAVNNDFTSQPGHHCFWIETNDSKQHIVSNNTFHTGLFLVGSHNGGDNVIISNNFFLDVDDRFIDFHPDCRSATFTNNVVSFLTEHEFVINSANKNNTDVQIIISNNRFYNAKAIVRVYNIVGVGTIYNHLVTNNIITSTSTVPIGIYNWEGAVLENCIENNNIFVQHTVGE